MRYQSVAMAGLLATVTVSPAAGQALPLREARPIVAAVDRVPISLDAFLLERGPSVDVARLKSGQGSAEDLALLDRLITVKLVVREGAAMGLNELPEIQRQIDVLSRQVLRDVLAERIAKDVRPDPAAVEKEFRNAVREWKTSALLVQDEAAAKKAHKELLAGAAFADVAARAVAAKAAKHDDDNAYARVRMLGRIWRPWIEWEVMPGYYYYWEHDRPGAWGIDVRLSVIFEAFLSGPK